MKTLTIDTKKDCYIINSDLMSYLQHNVASSLTLSKGTFDISITGGSYKPSQSKTEGEPFVLLWIYGVEGSKFINRNTGAELSTTWITLNGYNDRLKLEVKEKAVLCAFFFDLEAYHNSGSVDVLINSDRLFFKPHTLTVDSKQKCYVLDEKYVHSLRHSGSNLVELNPGNYRIKIREGNPSYWLENKKVNIDPWALIWVKGGKFSTKLTGVEVDETWFSLNDLKEEVVLEVKEKTTLTGLFFDTYKKNREGQIILGIEPLPESELANKRRELLENQQNRKQTVTDQTVTTNSTYLSNLGGERQLVSGNSSIGFMLRFNEEDFKKNWEQQLQQINTSIPGTIEPDATIDTKYWAQVEQWLLKHYEKHFKNLAVEVAKVRFSMDAYTQQIELSLNQQLQGWHSYLDQVLSEKINAEILKRVNQQIDQSFEQKIRDNIGLISQNVVNENSLKQYVDQHINRQVDPNFEKKIRSSIDLITQNMVKKQEIKEYIDRQVNQNKEQELRNSIELIVNNIVKHQGLNQHVNQQVDLYFDQKLRNSIELIANNIVKHQGLNQHIDQHVNRQVDQNFEQNIRKNIDLITQNLASSNQLNQHIDQHVDRQFDQNFEQKLRNNFDLIINNIASHQGLNQHVNQQVDQNFEQKLRSNVELIASNIVKHQGLNQHIDQHVNRQVNQNFEQNIRNNINLITQNLASSNELNQYLSQEIDNNFDRKIQDGIQAITQNIINDNDALNQYVDQRLQHNLTSNTLVINQILDDQQVTQKMQALFNNNSAIHEKIESIVINSPEINNRILNFVVNSNEISNKINNAYKDVDLKIDTLRNEWERTFMSLVRQYVDEMVNTIGERESFNIRIANAINVKVDELLNQILKTKNELTTLINNADRNLYEWTLGELMAIKGCLTDRQALVNHLISFSTKLTDKLDSANCVDINNFKPFKAIATNPTQLSPDQPQQLPASK